MNNNKSKTGKIAINVLLEMYFFLIIFYNSVALIKSLICIQNPIMKHSNYFGYVYHLQY